MAVNVHKYRYNKAAGVLNEGAEAPAPSAAPDFAAMAQAESRTGLPVQSLGGTRVGHGIPVAQATMHAQSVPARANRVAAAHAARTPDWAYLTSPGIAPSDTLHDFVPPGTDPSSRLAPPPALPGAGLDPTPTRSAHGMFHYTVEDGQRALMIRRDGTMEVIVGPRRIFRWGRRFERMRHYVAHPGEFLLVRFRDGRQQHHPGPANIWQDPREHLEITKEDALQISAKEAVVVYSQGQGGDGQLSRRIVYGPEVFVPRPGEWLHTFSWHGSQGGHKGYQKVPNGLVFQKLWLMPDQMYHDVPDVRTADDAVLTIRLMLFFELCDIETMLITTHDPIGDFVNAATSDVVDFTGRHDFDSFKRNTDKLNDLATYRQLTARAQQCGYRMNKIVYRGYGAPENLQRMHDEAIESRTRLQLQRATEQQAQELEDFKLERQLVRADRQRSEKEAQVVHAIAMEWRQKEAALQVEERRREFMRQQAERDAEKERARAEAQGALQRAHLGELREMGVDLTQLLTQGRADQVIELRGQSAGAHLHLPGAAPASPAGDDTK